MFETPYSTLYQTFDVTPTLQASLFPTISQTTNYYRPHFSRVSDDCDIYADADGGEEYNYYRKTFKSGAKTTMLSTNTFIYSEIYTNVTTRTLTTKENGETTYTTTMTSSTTITYTQTNEIPIEITDNLTSNALSTAFITAISITGAVVFFIIIGIAWFIVRQRKAGVDDPHKNEEESCDEDMLYHVYSLNQDDNQDALLEFFNYRVGNAPDTITEMNEDYDTSFRKDD